MLWPEEKSNILWKSMQMEDQSGNLERVLEPTGEAGRDISSVGCVRCGPQRRSHPRGMPASWTSSPGHTPALAAVGETHQKVGHVSRQKQQMQKKNRERERTRLTRCSDQWCVKIILLSHITTLSFTLHICHMVWFGLSHSFFKKIIKKPITLNETHN